jgi:uncharacterized protein YgbK (DUF1537 family)
VIDQDSSTTGEWESELARLAPPRDVPAAVVLEALRGAPRFIALDDDPTGTQTVRGVPVLTRWTAADVRWALEQDSPGFYILTNTRSQSRDEAYDRIREIVDVCVTEAAAAGVPVAFASRSDSTLRGHFPTEVDAVRDELASRGESLDGLVVAPAYLDAGRLTLHGVHLLRNGEGLIPVAESEFARDATFGYRSSRLTDWIEEKSGGTLAADDVETVDVDELRSDPSAAVEQKLGSLRDGGIAVLDAVDDADLRQAVLVAVAEESRGRRFVYQVGPSFVRARLGQGVADPIPDAQLAEIVASPAHGLVVVGSHVGLTTRQLAALRADREVADVELDVASLLATPPTDTDLDALIALTAERIADALQNSLVVVSTSRVLVRGDSADDSLAIARRVSDILTRVVRAAYERGHPSYVVAKGGITSSDVATESLELGRAWVRGSLLPGIVSLWQGVDGRAAGLPYVVFAGNVGADDALARVVERLEAARGHRHQDQSTAQKESS